MVYTMQEAVYAAHREALSQWPKPGGPLACRSAFRRPRGLYPEDETTGDVILSRRPESWDNFFKLRREASVPDEFMADRQDEAPQKRELF
jgi:hypothetical protein